MLLEVPLEMSPAKLPTQKRVLVVAQNARHVPAQQLRQGDRVTKPIDQKRGRRSGRGEPRSLPGTPKEESPD
jgi:hypothetical protein